MRIDLHRLARRVLLLLAAPAVVRLCAPRTGDLVQIASAAARCRDCDPDDL